MKIGYMFIRILLICCATPLVSADHKKNAIQSMAGLSRSASSFFPQTTSPAPTPSMPTAMVSPHREPFIEGVAEMLQQLYDSGRKALPQKKSSESIITYPSNRSPIIFEKVPLPLPHDQPLSESVDSNESEAAFHIDIDDESKSIIDKGMKPKIFVTDDEGN